MIYKLVSVKDRAANAFMQPFFVHTAGQAIRSFSDEINRIAADNHLGRHPEDYDLYLLGSFNDQDGRFINHEGVPEQIAIGKQVKIA